MLSPTHLLHNCLTWGSPLPLQTWRSSVLGGGGSPSTVKHKFQASAPKSILAASSFTQSSYSQGIPIAAENARRERKKELELEALRAEREMSGSTNSRRASLKGADMGDMMASRATLGSLGPDHEAPGAVMEEGKAPEADMGSGSSRRGSMRGAAMGVLAARTSLG